MWSIIIVLILGILVGIFIKPKKNTKKLISSFQFIGVVLLLFAMGAGLGLNEDLLSNIQSMGFEALTFAITTSVLSIVLVYFSTRFIMKGK